MAVSMQVSEYSSAAFARTHLLHKPNLMFVQYGVSVNQMPRFHLTAGMFLV